MTKFFRRKKIIVFSIFVFAIFFARSKNLLFAATEKNWIVAAEKFSIASNNEDSDSVKFAIQELLPSRIVENLSSTSYRLILADEELARTLYTLKNERISLFLQLSSAVRAKDSLFLNDYSEKKLQSLQKEEDKKIKSIQEKIDANLAAQKEAEEKAEKKQTYKTGAVEKTEGQKYLNLIKGLVSTKDMSLSSERVSLYEKSDSNLYKPSDAAKKAGYVSHAFEKEMVNAKINSLLTGTISFVGEYMSVTVELFVYPGCKSAGVVTEVGSINDIDFISTSIARQISPWISASMPVVIKLNLQPEEAKESVRFSIDDIVYRNLQDEYVIDSGVHSLRFDAQGYKTAITYFNFEGNTVYNIDVGLQEERTGSLQLKMKKPLVGSVYGNGEFADDVDEENKIATIKINDSVILGQFIGSEGGSGFFYVPEKLVSENASLDVNLKTFDKNEYIDKRRRMMYTSYSVLVVSLIGLIVTNGNVENYSAAYSKNKSNTDMAAKANSWIIASDVCLGVTIGTGCWFGYELFRYLKAADSVLPANAKKSKKKEGK